MKRLNIIGGGRVGRTLARLWADRGGVTVQDILNRTRESGEGAVRFIGAGRAAGSMADLRPAELFMLTTPDDAIAEWGRSLADSGPPLGGRVVFHCSGALPSSVLDDAAAAGAGIASVHPIKSFPDPGRAVETFPGTYCGCEGDAAALDRLREPFESIGATLFPIDSERKVTYHAAAVLACNYLTTLIASGAELYAESGIPGERALDIMEPIVRETIDNIFAAGPASALTGPIARGDHATVRRQQEALARWSPELCDLYRALGRRTIVLAHAGGDTDPATVAALEEALDC